MYGTLKSIFLPENSHNTVYSVLWAFICLFVCLFYLGGTQSIICVGNLQQTMTMPLAEKNNKLEWHHNIHDMPSVEFLTLVVACLVCSFYPARACASKGLCDRSWCLLYIYYISARTFFYLSKYSLSDAHFSTGRLLFEFNRLQYTLAAPEVFVSSANPVILPSGYRVSIVRNTNIYQIETTPLLYC